MYSSQYGFCENVSTQHAIVDIGNLIQSNMGNKLFICSIFLDRRKGFDTVDHSILLSKLYFGIRGPVKICFSPCLNSCVQTTQIIQTSLNYCMIKQAVPKISFIQICCSLVLQYTYNGIAV